MHEPCHARHAFDNAHGTWDAGQGYHLKQGKGLYAKTKAHILLFRYMHYPLLKITFHTATLYFTQSTQHAGCLPCATLTLNFVPHPF